MLQTSGRSLAVALATAGLLLAGSAQADEALPDAPSGKVRPAVARSSDCSGGSCTYRLTPAQLLSTAEGLVMQKRFDEARPLVAALASAPGMEMPYAFLEGMIAIESGDPKSATKFFRSILKDHPGQTRVRLELARALMMQGKMASADYHLRLAQNDEDLPDDIARMIGNARSVIRSNRRFRFGFDVGIAPDTNINSATAAETVDINFGGSRLALELDDNAKAKSGIGITASAYASLRLPATEKMAVVVDSQMAMTNYEGGDLDDYTAQLAAGPELAIGDETSLSVQAVGLYRWYGGEVAARQYGSRVTLQHTLDRDKRIAFQFDGRRTESDLNAGYTGWQLGANATYEQVVAKSAIASASVYARRDIMDFDPYSNNTIGVNAGIGGELPFGLNAGVSGGASYAKYDSPQLFFSNVDREDWRFQGRAYVGLREVRFLGLSPSVEYNYQRVESNYDFYKTDRHRVHFKVARYF
ncbi:MAG: DUF560 domain-containing protein [Novosphingobium sp.]|nr:DUF560 domain-containing protein [Novosphingobium sp.]